MGSHHPGGRKICAPSTSERLKSLRSIVDDYIAEYRDEAATELNHFRDQPSLAEAIRFSTWAIAENGQRHGHQRRRSFTELSSWNRALQGRASVIRRSASFEQLHDLLGQLSKDISGIGRLTVYDTAQRLGAFKGLRPRRVYLHRGTRVGAKNLGLDVSLGSLELALFPRELRRLRPYEIEDCLCIYKAHFRPSMLVGGRQ
jgi:hypothetical protein